MKFQGVGQGGVLDTKHLKVVWTIKNGHRFGDSIVN